MLAARCRAERKKKPRPPEAQGLDARPGLKVAVSKKEMLKRIPK
jgi:hypothetical protein